MNKKYAENLIKGRITEVIFEEMFRQSKKFTIIPLGYEHTTPILAQYQHLLHIQKVLDNIRSAPDFALISENKFSVYLVEVKYRDSFTNEDLLKIANEISTRWNPSYLFVASRDGFYFSPCNGILNDKGRINELEETWINKDIQQEYLTLLHNFINI